MLGKAAGSLLGEEELHEHEEELEEEFEHEHEHEGEQEMAHEIASHELTHNEAVAEMMAEAASHEAHEGEAEAMAGAAAVTVISPSDRRALRRILPHLVRGTAILTRILRRRRITRPIGPGSTDHRAPHCEGLEAAGSERAFRSPGNVPLVQPPSRFVVC